MKNLVRSSFRKLRGVKKSSKILVVSALAVITVLLTYYLPRWENTTGVDVPPDSELVVSEDVVNPSEKQVDINVYSVPDDEPRLITIPKISSLGIVQKVGLTSESAIAVPSNVYFAGWYVGSVIPGDEGLSIIDGHVSGRYTDGIFKNLASLATGDIIEVEFGDRSIRAFEVVETRILPENESAKYLFNRNNDIEQQLNLITCGGDFDSNSQQFSDRVIIVTKRIK